MAHWLFPANTKFYDVLGAFSEPQAFWPAGVKVAAGDVVYIYLAAPQKQVAFVCEVVETGFSMEQVMEKVRPFFLEEPPGDRKPKAFMKLKPIKALPLSADSPLGYSRLKSKGLGGMLMGPRKLDNNPELLRYVQGAADEL